MADQGPLPTSAPSQVADLERTCFVIMPFGKKKVGNHKVDFTQLYVELFEPAIKAAKTSGDDHLIDIYSISRRSTSTRATRMSFSVVSSAACARSL